MSDARRKSNEEIESRVGDLENAYKRVDATTNQVAIAGANATGAVDGDDNNSTLWAERKGLI